MYGKIKTITEVFDCKIQFKDKMVDIFGEYEYMDGYKVETDKHVIYVLIENEQSCCESWGYFASEDDLNQFIGAELIEINLTDTALNKEKVEKSDYYDDGGGGGIQFVDFVTDRGIFQLAVYNAHHGYYGHGIVVAIDNDIIFSEIF